MMFSQRASERSGLYGVTVCRRIGPGQQTAGQLFTCRCCSITTLFVCRRTTAAKSDSAYLERSSLIETRQDECRSFQAHERRPKSATLIVRVGATDRRVPWPQA
jgi:hypothetical protein